MPVRTYDFWKASCRPALLGSVKNMLYSWIYLFIPQNQKFLGGLVTYSDRTGDFWGAYSAPPTDIKRINEKTVIMLIKGTFVFKRNTPV